MMFYFNKKLKIKNKEKESLTGFTILEVIAAIFVMTVGVLGAYSVVQQIIVYTSISSSRLTAAYLAQEGIEIVRNIRDTNWLESAPSWSDGLGAGDWEADYNESDLSTYSGNPLNLETATGLYGYDSGTSTKFKRKITITPVGADKLKVSVEITWPGDSVTVEEHLYNWY